MINQAKKIKGFGLYVFVILFLLQIILSNSVLLNQERNRVLVIVDSNTYFNSHSLLFQDLEESGYDVKFGGLNSVNLKLQEYDEYIYDHMIILATSEMTDKGLSLRKILDFYDAGNNVFIAGDINTSISFRKLFNDFGVEIDSYGTQIWDDFNKADFTNDNSIIFTKNAAFNQQTFGSETQFPILYKGISLKIPNTDKVWPILKAENTAYSFNSEYQKISIQGHNNVLVAAIQSRNNARAILTGSLEMLSNNYFLKNKYSNRQYVKNILQWNFQENGILKAENIRHHKEGENEIPFSYKIEEQIYYYIDIYRWDIQMQQWVPYVCNDHQIMLEFIMLDPYYRVPLLQENGTSLYKTSFKAPDVYGVFQFNIQYSYPGYSFLDEQTKVPVRPPKHNEFERFLPQAYPYYTSAFLSIGGFFVFMVFFLYDSEKQKVKSE